jgi:hypothetical protein
LVKFVELAGRPSAPSDVPVSETSVTTDREIRVTFGTPEPEANGSQILSYELLMDNGQSGEFISLIGF